MKSLRGQAASKSSEIPNPASYDRVAAEYYDVELHPTCADFRVASAYYVDKLFQNERPIGRVADIGSGKSLLAEFISNDLVLVDDSQEMLDRNLGKLEKRQINVEQNPFGVNEFDWIFAVLADPYNSLGAWQNIKLALKDSGRCVFIVPSHFWTQKFRESSKEERFGFARFDLADGTSTFLQSLVFSSEQQQKLILSAGLRVRKVEHVLLRDLDVVRSRKISNVLSDEDAVLDIYRVEK